jgi:hypothetical protein
MHDNDANESRTSSAVVAVSRTELPYSGGLTEGLPIAQLETNKCCFQIAACEKPI